MCIRKHLTTWENWKSLAAREPLIKAEFSASLVIWLVQKPLFAYSSGLRKYADSRKIVVDFQFVEHLRYLPPVMGVVHKKLT